jgi:hypothetical protein
VEFATEKAIRRQREREREGMGGAVEELSAHGARAAPAASRGQEEQWLR